MCILKSYKKEKVPIWNSSILLCWFFNRRAIMDSVFFIFYMKSIEMHK